MQCAHPTVAAAPVKFRLLVIHNGTTGVESDMMVAQQLDRSPLTMQEGWGLARRNDWHCRMRYSSAVCVACLD